MKINKIFFPLLLLILILNLNKNVFGWSWRDLKIGETTEEELINLGGMPTEIILEPADYLALKGGKTSTGVKFKYVINSIFGVPSKTPPIYEGPLGLSDEIWEIEMYAQFSKNKLQFYTYKFKFKSEFNMKKYTNIFNSLLGEPINIKEDELGTTVSYKNYYLWFKKGWLESDSIFLNSECFIK